MAATKLSVDLSLKTLNNIHGGGLVHILGHKYLISFVLAEPCRVWDNMIIEKLENKFLYSII
jgi:hypothetical protein